MRRRKEGEGGEEGKVKQSKRVRRSRNKGGGEKIKK